MTTLNAIGLTLLGGSCVAIVSTALFGIAVSRQSVFVAPRAFARPPSVIYDKHLSSEASCSKRTIRPAFAWLPWVMQLTYDTMLKGVPGTGTRKGGLAGSLLKVNLDGIILLRYHAMCRRITLFASLLFVIILIPVYFSARCSKINHHEKDACESDVYNLTNYEMLTLATLSPHNMNETDYMVIFSNHEGILWRLYMTVLCFWAVLLYALYVLDREWIQVLAMRRVYYLEHDVWGERVTERKNVQSTDVAAAVASRGVCTQKTLMKNTDKGCSNADNEDAKLEQENLNHLMNREPWIPHPEQRETIPNVSLYSVLVGHLPCLPEEAVDAYDAEAAEKYTQRDSIDWQLSLTAAFFDHCVPNQPGYSSSVAAVTVLPISEEMTQAWRKWYKAASKLRRLRFIQKQIYYRQMLTVSKTCNDDGLGEDSNYWQQKMFEYGNKDGDDDDDKHLLNDVTAFGPEQAAVFNREFAEAASSCCPNGYNEENVREMSVDDLIMLERDVAIQVHQANCDLREVRRHITRTAESNAAEHADVSSKDVYFSSKSDDTPLSRRKTPLNVRKSVLLPLNLGLESKLYQESNFLKQSSTSNKSRQVDDSSDSSNNYADALEDEQTDSYEIPSRHINSSFADPPENEKEAELLNTIPSAVTLDTSWSQVTAILSRVTSKSGKTVASVVNLANGRWQAPTMKGFLRSIKDFALDVKTWAKGKSFQAVDSLARGSTFAIVTFTSRQAAVAARTCLADGRGAQRWVTVQDIPTPPLADAAPCDLIAFRNCCRPVTISINDRQKLIRRYMSLVMLGTIYIFYTVPLTYASLLVTPSTLVIVFPSNDSYSSRIFELLSGFFSATIYSCFFASCPILFKVIANFGSGARSVAHAEFRALQFYWWFMIVTAFSGQLLTQMVLTAVAGTQDLVYEFKVVMSSVAITIPSRISASWLNWIIFRFTITLPMNYLLQFDTFLFDIFGLKCLARSNHGGGPGGPSPYRLIVDSGVVLLCTFALGPSSPLVALASLLYFIVIEPILRRNLILVYRPQYDAGGARWTYMFDIVISSLLYGGILLTTQMLLKKAIGPAILAILSLPVVYVFWSEKKRKYQRSFDDAALMQTSLLDGWDTSASTSATQREEFRRFLVDAHKAAYVPVCIAGSDTDGFMTAEPAVVLPLESDLDTNAIVVTKELSPNSINNTGPSQQVSSDHRRTQRGATLRRAASIVMSNSSSGNTDNTSDVSTNDEHPISPTPRMGGLQRQRGVTLRRACHGASLAVKTNGNTDAAQVNELEDIHFDSPFTALASRRNIFDNS